MTSLTAVKANLKRTSRELITSGSVNAFWCQFRFSADWDGLSKTASFRAGKDERSVVLDETGRCKIPWEVLENPGKTLYAGVCGTKGGELVLPTIWCSLDPIAQGASPGDESRDPTPGVYEQLLGNIGDLGELKTENKKTLVEAINEVCESGGGTVSVASDAEVAEMFDEVFGPAAGPVEQK